MLNFDNKNEFPNVTIIELKNNYRSTPEIVKIANYLISNNEQRDKKTLISVRNKGHKPTIFDCLDQQQEVEDIINIIKKLKQEKKIEYYSDVMILYRENRYSLEFEKQLVSANIPYLVYGSRRFLEKKEIQLVICFLKTLAYNDNFSLTKFLAELPTVGSRTIKYLHDQSKTLNTSIFKLIQDKKWLDKIPKKFNINNKLKNYFKFLTEINQEVLENDDLDFRSYINKIFKVKFEIYEEYNIAGESNKIDNIDAFLYSITEFSTENPDLKSKDLIVQFLDNYNFLEDVYPNNEERKKPLHLSTIHKSKGLEKKPYL